MVNFRGQRGRSAQYSYNAIVDKGRRQPAKTRTTQADFDLSGRKRGKLVATARDQIQNLALPAWMVRKHISYVSQFNFHPNTGTPELDAALIRRVKKASTKDEFDIAGRHSLRSGMAITETGKVVDGQAFIAAVEGYKCQLLEADRIAKPKNLPKSWEKRVDENGLVKDRYGKTTHYCRCKWSDSRRDLEYDGVPIKRESMLFDGGYYSRASQTIGVSPLSTALNAFRDLYEGWEYTLIKIKVHALFGVSISRDLEGDDNGFNTTGTSDPDIDADGESHEQDRAVMNIKDGLMNFDLDPGESVAPIESQTPNSNVITYSEMIIRAALIACDIPYSEYDGRGSSFSHTMAARAEYEKSAAMKREDNREFLEKWIRWKLDQFAEEDGELATMLRGQSLDDIAELCEWVPDGAPWMDKSKEVKADADEIANGTNSRQRQCKRRGKDFFKIADELAAEEDYMRERNVSYVVGAPGATAGNGTDPKPPTEEDVNEEA